MLGSNWRQRTCHVDHVLVHVLHRHAGAGASGAIAHCLCEQAVSHVAGRRRHAAGRLAQRRAEPLLNVVRQSRRLGRLRIVSGGDVMVERAGIKALDARRQHAAGRSRRRCRRRRHEARRRDGHRFRRRLLHGHGRHLHVNGARHRSGDHGGSGAGRWSERLARFRFGAEAQRVRIVGSAHVHHARVEGRVKHGARVHVAARVKWRSRRRRLRQRRTRTTR